MPEGSTSRHGYFTDSDHGPTKSVIITMRNDAKNKKFYDLCFAKRGAVELYNCKKNPEQINNLASNPEHAETIKKLPTQLEDYFKKTEGPRFTDKLVKFESSRYK